jgi:hypothetical protein
MNASTVPDIGALGERLRGHRLPGGYFTIEPEQAETVARLLNISHPAHPIFGSIASLRSLGVSISDLCALCEFELAAGPMLGEFAVRFMAPLQPGVRYEVSAQIDSIDRVRSSRLGALDRLRFTVMLAHSHGAAVAEARYLWLLPRGNSVPS